VTGPKKRLMPNAAISANKVPNRDVHAENHLALEAWEKLGNYRKNSPALRAIQTANNQSAT